jgi:hypothetical protein
MQLHHVAPTIGAIENLDRVDLAGRAGRSADIGQPSRGRGDSEGAAVQNVSETASSSLSGSSRFGIARATSLETSPGRTWQGMMPIHIIRQARVEAGRAGEEVERDGHHQRTASVGCLAQDRREGDYRHNEKRHAP